MKPEKQIIIESNFWKIFIIIMAILATAKLGFEIYSIVFLSTNVPKALKSAEMAKRDSQRVRDLDSIQTALDFYYTDHKYYPDGQGILGSDNFACLNESGWEKAGCSNPYITDFLKDPGYNKYYYEGKGSTYLLKGTLEGTYKEYSGELIFTPQEKIQK